MNKRNIVVIWTVIILIIIIWLAVYAIKNSNISHDMSHESVENTENETISDKTLDYMYEQDNIMHTMMDSMINIQKSGSADVDFLAGMIPHHEAAVEMAESYLKYGAENEEMKTLAENIITTQNEEIELMNNMIKNVQIQSTSGDIENNYMIEYNEMMQHSHTHNDAGYDNIDMAFAEGMLEHHKMAVDMAELIIKYGEDGEVVRLAENIVKVQNKEIEQMNDFLNS